MFIQQDNPLPPELMPLDRRYYLTLAEDLAPVKVIQLLREKIARLQPEWGYFDANTKLKLLEGLHENLFGRHVPQPQCKLTFSRVRFTALFYCEDWSMRFAENFFVQYTFEKAFRTWLHEDIHALFHFAGLRLNPVVAADVLNPPLTIVNMARQMGHLPDSSPLFLMGKRNLLGMIDRSMNHITPRNYRSVRIGDHSFMAGSTGSLAGAGWDSYYLNVEISVENLTEVLFKKVFPNVLFHRSYVTAEEYIRRRKQGIGPAFAVK